MRRILVLILAALLVASCSGAAEPSAEAPTPGGSPSPATDIPEPSADPTAVPTEALTPTAAPSATAGPSPVAEEPPADLKRVAVVERDGVRVRLELERNPMPAGESTSLTAVVRNVGKDVMTWFHDGCAIAVTTWGEMPVEWRRGIHHTGNAEMFKGLVLGYEAGSTPMRGPIIDFVPERHLGKGSFACPDIGIGDEIAPGKAVTQRFVWEGQAGIRWGPPPTGLVTLTGTFHYYWRGRTEPENLDLDQQEIPVSLDAWVTNGAHEGLLSPPEVVDAALTDEAFVRYLGTQELRNGREEILWYRQDEGFWEVGILAWYDAATPQMHLVHVDPHTGEVLATVDRPWDEQLDGFP